MTDSIARLREEHINFSKLLDLLEGQLELFHRGNAPNYQLMLDIMYYMTHYPDVFHHPKEDLAFAKVKEREIKARPVVDELMNQHVVLRESGETLVEDLEGIVNGAMLARDSVEAPGRIYIEYFRKHMHMEETDVFPSLARILDDKDWATINAAIRHQEDPLFGKTVEARYETLRRQIDRDGVI